MTTLSGHFRHRYLLKENQRALLCGALTLLGVDLIGAMMPLIVKGAIEVLKGTNLSSLLPLDLVSNLEMVSGPWALAALVCLFLGLHGLIAYFRYWWRVFLIWSTYPIADRMRQELFSHVISLHRDFFKQKKIGDLLSALTTDTENLRMTLSVGALMAIDVAINFILFPALMFYLDAELALVVFPLIALATLFAFKASARIVPIYSRVQNLTGDLSAKTHELISGVRLIKAFAAQNRFFMPYSKLNDDFKKSSLSVAAYEAFYSPFLEFIRGLCVVFVLIYGGFKVIEGRLDLSSLIAFQIYLNYLDWPMMALGWSLKMYRHSEAAATRIRALTDIENPLESAAENSKMKTRPNGIRALPIHHRVGDKRGGTPSLERVTDLNEADAPLIQVRNLEIKYQGANPSVLGPFNFDLREGEWLGLTGSIGTGKSTLLEALSRQRDPSKGSILYRGSDLSSWDPKELREGILYIPQEAFLFSHSIRGNLTLNQPHHRDEMLVELLSDLEFEMKDIMERGGLNTRLGERGTNFSGGQKQRLALGRALLCTRELYLLDDVFSHIDIKTEAKLIELLKKRLPGDAAVILVSHRPSTLAYCSRVLELS